MYQTDQNNGRLWLFPNDSLTPLKSGIGKVSMNGEPLYIFVYIFSLPYLLNFSSFIDISIVLVHYCIICISSRLDHTYKDLMLYPYSQPNNWYESGAYGQSLATPKVKDMVPSILYEFFYPFGSLCNSMNSNIVTFVSWWLIMHCIHYID